MLALLSGALVYYLISLKDIITYQTHSNKPTILGSAEYLKVDALAHNQFVTIRLITDDRAAQAAWMRDLSFRQNYIYFHVQGAPLLVEISDAINTHIKLQPYQQITLSGRLVKTHHSSQYQKLAQFFKNQFHIHQDQELAILQVDVKPQEQIKYSVFVLLCICFIGFNIYYVLHKRNLTR